MFVVNNIASIYSRINITRAIETRIVRSQEARERVTDRLESEMRESYRENRWGGGERVIIVEQMSARECMRV